MRKLAFAIAMGLIASALVPVLAQSNVGGGSIKIKKNQLGDGTHIEPAPRQIQILNKDPIITDHRTRPRGEDTLEINVAPLEPEPGNHYVYGEPGKGGGSKVILKSTPQGFLAPASDMHRSNIGSPAVDTSKLQPGRSTGVHGPGSVPPKQHTQEQRHVNGTIKPARSAPVTVKGYPDHTGGGGASSGQNSIKTEVTGTVKIAPGTLKKRLLEKN